MNERKTLPHLVDLLVAEYAMDRKEADTFVRGMFELIEEALVTEKFVKVKGLGTFKLTDVDSRESVNVRTGERFEIQEHRKITFIPESALKDLINKPFSHFENVLLNEDTELPDTEVFIENNIPSDEDAAEEEEDAAPSSETPSSEVASLEVASLEVSSSETLGAASGVEAPSETVVPLESENASEAEVAPAAGNPSEAEAAPEVESPSEAEVAPEVESPSEAEVAPVAELPLETEKVPTAENSSELEAAPVGENPSELEAAPVGENPSETETASESEPAPAPASQETPEEESIPVIGAEEPAKASRKAKKSGGKKALWVILVLLVLFGLGYGLAGLLTSWSDDDTPVAEEPVEQAEDEAPFPEAPTDSLAVDSLQQAAADTASAAQAVPVVEPKPIPAKPVATGVEKVAPAGQAAATAPSAPRAAYQITGTKTTHTLQPGETLRIIAEKYYGNRNLSKYIVQHNASVITNPDLVPAGTKLNIPELTPTGE